MKKLLIFLLIAITVLPLISCGENGISPTKVEYPEDEYRKDGDPDADKADAGLENSYFSNMSESEFRSAVVPCLEAWYKYVYRGMWWLNFTASSKGETVSANGKTYVKITDYKSLYDIKTYLSQWLSDEIVESVVAENAIEKKGAVYVFRVATGWFSEPDYCCCKLLKKNEDGEYYISFEETDCTSGKERTSFFVIKLKIVDDKPIVCGRLSTTDAIMLVKEKLIESSVSFNLLSNAEFQKLATVMLCRHNNLVSAINYDETTIKRYPAKEDGTNIVASVNIDEKEKYFIIGKDNIGSIEILKFAESVDELFEQS